MTNINLNTNQQGIAITHLDDGSYVYLATKAGYVSEGDTFEVDGSALQIDITMFPEPPIPPTEYTVTFVVTDGEDEIENVNINIAGEDLLTDVNGEADIDLPNGTYPFVCTHPDFTDFISSVTVLNDDITVNITMVTAPVFEWGVRVFIFDADTENIIENTDSQIIATIDGVTHTGLDSTTFGSGGLGYLVQSPLSWTPKIWYPRINEDVVVTIEDVPGYLPFSGLFYIPDDLIHDPEFFNWYFIHVYLTPTPVTSSTITFEVTDGETDLPIGNAMISVAGQTRFTDSLGLASIVLPEGNYNYNVHAIGYQLFTGSFTGTGTNQTIEVELFPLVPSYSLNVKVLSCQTGDFLIPATVELLDYYGMTVLDTKTQTSSNGVNFFDLPTNSLYVVRLSAEDYITTNFVVEITNQAINMIKCINSEESANPLNQIDLVSTSWRWMTDCYDVSDPGFYDVELNKIVDGTFGAIKVPDVHTLAHIMVDDMIYYVGIWATANSNFCVAAFQLTFDNMVLMSNAKFNSISSPEGAINYAHSVEYGNDSLYVATTFNWGPTLYPIPNNKDIPNRPSVFRINRYNGSIIFESFCRNAMGMVLDSLGQYLYVRSYYPEENSNRIYKINAINGNREFTSLPTLPTDGFSNVYNFSKGIAECGDFVYFSNGDQNGTIYRINKNLTNLTTFKTVGFTIRNMTCDVFGGLYVCGGRLSPSNDYNCCKINTSTSDIIWTRKLTELNGRYNAIQYKNADVLFVGGDWLYRLNPQTGDIMEIFGDEETQESSGSTCPPFVSQNISNIQLKY